MREKTCPKSFMSITSINRNSLQTKSHWVTENGRENDELLYRTPKKRDSAFWIYIYDHSVLRYVLSKSKNDLRGDSDWLYTGLQTCKTCTGNRALDRKGPINISKDTSYAMESIAVFRGVSCQDWANSNSNRAIYWLLTSVEISFQSPNYSTSLKTCSGTIIFKRSSVHRDPA